MKSVKAIQYFSDEALERGKALSPLQIIEFVEGFRNFHFQKEQKSQLISIKVPVDLLRVFKLKAHLKGKRYQTWIKELMQKAMEST